MGTINVAADKVIDAPADKVFVYIADMHEHHPHILPTNFTDFVVESGGVGAGTVTTFKITAGGRTRSYHMDISEPEPGRVLKETDRDSSLVNTFTVEPQGEVSRVTISTTWEGAGGIGGFFEKTFAPRAVKGIYADELDRLDAYARQQAGG